MEQFKLRFTFTSVVFSLFLSFTHLFADLMIVQKLDVESYDLLPTRKYAGRDENFAQTLTLYIKGNKARFEWKLDSGKRSGYQIMDHAVHRMYVVEENKTGERVWNSESEAKFLDELFQASQISIQETGKRKRMNGFDAKEYIITKEDENQSSKAVYWGIPDVKAVEYQPFRTAVDYVTMKFGSKALSIKALPVRIEIVEQNRLSESKYTIDTLKISREPLPDSLFVFEPED